ncbi:MAG: metallophosphoesterase [Acutalibacteraceae bacterium]
MIYITGDTHGDKNFISQRKLKKLNADDILIITGDFGFFWENNPSEKSNIEYLSKQKFRILFLDGTHENFSAIENYETVTIYGGKAHKISNNIYHLMRGQIYIIDGKGIFTFGGGESSDYEALLDSGKWQEREMPTDEEMEKGVLELKKYGRKIDYIITHEPPSTIKTKINNHLILNKVNSYLEHIKQEVIYEKWFFGALHVDTVIDDNIYGVFTDVLPANATKKARNF